MSKDSSGLDSLKEEYLSQIRGLFPLYRAALLVVALVIVVAVQNSKFKSVSEGLLHLQLRTLADFDKGFFSTLTVQDVLIAVGILLLGVMLHRLVRWLFFLWLRKRLKLDDVAKAMSEKSAASSDRTIVSYFALKKSENEATNWGKKVSGLSLMSESILTLSLVFIYAGCFGNLIDFGVALVLFVCALLAAARSFIVFLRYYLPHTAHIRGFLGQGNEVKLP
ncbi:MAG: hypothetical protein PHH47_07210 [Gallionella sp.]|nr:hypothetical protein [Gallionella sp.]MDD4947876.1 hypothetical protein [Gallionella sp.]